MKHFIILLGLIILIISCGKEKEIKNAKDDYDNFDFYQIKKIKGFDQANKKDVEAEVYESIKGKRFLNQYKQFDNNNIDSLNTYFYTLKLTKSKPDNYIGKIELICENKKILGIEFKTIIKIDGKSKTLNFKSKNSTSILFNFTNVDSYSEIKGVLCINLETDIIIGGKKEKGYYNRYMFVDNKEMTDNLFIKKYKNK